MSSLSTRIMLFLCSYAPFFLIFALLYWNNQPVIAGLSASLGVLSTLGTLLYLRWCKRQIQPGDARIRGITQRDNDVMSYIASYLLPFVTASFGAWQQFVALLVFLIVLAIIYINSNMIYVNPVLSIVGYHLYEIEIEYSVNKLFYIARRRVLLGDKIGYVRINDNFFLEC